MNKKKIAVLFADGFEEIEALTVVDYLRRAELRVDMISIKDTLEVTGAHEITIICEKLLENIDPEYDMVVLPGGLPGAENLRDSEEVLSFIKQTYSDNNYLAAICAAPIVLEKAGLTKDKKGTSYPGFEKDLSFTEYKEDILVQDGRLITARGPATAIYFALKIIEALASKEKSSEVAKGLLLPLVEDTIGKK